MKTKFPEHLLPDWPGRPTLAGRRGSRAHDTAREDSDYDWFCIWAHPPSHYYGLSTVSESPRNSRQETYHQCQDDQDLLVVDLPKYFQYLSRNLPDYHEWLWFGPDNLVFLGKAGSVLLANREKFLGDFLSVAFWNQGLALSRDDNFVHDLAWLRLLQGQAIVRDGELPTRGLTWHGDYGKVLEEGRGNLGWVGPDWEFYDSLCRFAMSHEWGLTLEGR